MSKSKQEVTYKKRGKYYYFKTKTMTNFKTTEKTTKSEAERFVLDLLSDQKQPNYNMTDYSSFTFKKYAKDFFDYEKCPRLNRLRAEGKTRTKRSCDSARKDLVNFVFKTQRVLKTNLSKRSGSRASVFTAEEKEKLLPLPQNKFETFEEKEAVVARDYHVQYDSAFYSVPAKYIKDKVRVRATSNTVMIFTLKGTEIACHKRADHKWQRVTDKSHIPASYSDYTGYTRDGFAGQASRYGEKTVEWVNSVLDSFDFEVQGYRTVATALTYARNVVPEAVEKTCEELLRAGITNSKGFKIFLRRYSELIGQQEAEPDVNSLFCFHEEAL